jgi:hypothetical protein
MFFLERGRLRGLDRWLLAPVTGSIHDCSRGGAVAESNTARVMAERVQTLKMPSSMPVVIQLDNTALDTFLKGLMQALQEMGAEVAEARSKASSSEATAAHLIQQVRAQCPACSKLFPYPKPCPHALHGIACAANLSDDSRFPDAARAQLTLAGVWPER